MKCTDASKRNATLLHDDQVLALLASIAGPEPDSTAASARINAIVDEIHQLTSAELDRWSSNTQRRRSSKSKLLSVVTNVGFRPFSFESGASRKSLSYSSALSPPPLSTRSSIRRASTLATELSAIPPIPLFNSLAPRSALPVTQYAKKAHTKPSFRSFVQRMPIPRSGAIARLLSTKYSSPSTTTTAVRDFAVETPISPTSICTRPKHFHTASASPTLSNVISPQQSRTVPKRKPLPVHSPVLCGQQ